MRSRTRIAQLEARAGVMKALAHASRLLIVESLANGEKCVGELTRLVGADTSTVSRHLSVLKNAGLLSDHKRGQQVFYALKCRCALDFLTCIEGVLRTRARDRDALTRDVL